MESIVHSSHQSGGVHINHAGGLDLQSRPMQKAVQTLLDSTPLTPSQVKGVGKKTQYLYPVRPTLLGISFKGCSGQQGSAQWGSFMSDSEYRFKYFLLFFFFFLHLICMDPDRLSNLSRP